MTELDMATDDFFEVPAERGFLISQKAIIIQDGKILLLENHEEPPKWELPGGLLDFDESPEEGLMREVQEEIGLAVSVQQPLNTVSFWIRGFVLRDGRRIDARIFRIAYLCTVIGGDMQVSHEHQNYQWIRLDELHTVDLYPSTEETLQRYLNSAD